MKKFFVLVCSIFLSFISFSQTDFGFRGGVNLANQLIKVKAFEIEASQSGKVIPSFHLGAFADFPIGHHISIRPELLFSGKGANFKQENDFGEETTTKIRPYYLEMPITVMYTHGLRNGIRLFGGLGPSLGYGLFGKVESEGEKEDVFQDEGFKRFDLGIQFRAGVELPSRLFFSAGFTQGLTNLIDVPDAGDDLKWTNNVFEFSLGYFLNRK